VVACSGWLRMNVADQNNPKQVLCGSAWRSEGAGLSRCGVEWSGAECAVCRASIVQGAMESRGCRRRVETMGGDRRKGRGWRGGWWLGDRCFLIGP